MKNPFRFLVCVVACVATIPLSTPSPARADSFTVEQWGLNISVYQWPDLVGDSYMTVVNPFSAAHQVTLPSNPATMAAAQYDISWLLDYGSFNISAQLAAQDGNSVRSLASGTIYLQSDSALTITVDALLNYNLPTYGLYASLSFAVRDLTANQYIFSRTELYDSITGPPSAGSLGIASDVVLPTGHQFRVQYSLRLDTFGYSSGLATADGHVNFTISPEPASLALVAPLVIALSRRAARRQHLRG